MDVRARRPTEPEQAEGDEECADESWGEAFFGANLTGLRVEFRFHVFVDVPEEWGDGDQCAKEDAYESEAGFSSRKMVDALEDYGEGFEPEVKNGVDERDVKVKEEEDGFCEGEGEGPD